MKPIYTPLVFFLIAFLSLTGITKSSAQTPADYTFSIHLGTFVKAQLSDFENVQPMGFIYAEKFQNNLMQIYLGEFPTEAAGWPLLNQIKAKGYPDAYITRKNLQQGERVYIIQLGIAAAGEKINWADYVGAGPMYAMLRNQQTTIATGVFDSSEEANQRLGVVKKLGYTTANVISLNNIYLHKVSTFETGGEIVAPQVDIVVGAPLSTQPEETIEEVEVQTLPEITPETITETVPEVVAVQESAPIPQRPKPKTSLPIVAAPITISTGRIAEAPAKESTPPPVVMIPTSYDDVLASRSPLAAAQPTKKEVEVPTTKTVVPVKETIAPKTVAMPYIRPKVKRTSAIELQKVLKKEGTYTGSLDGFYGRGTKDGYAEIMKENTYLQRYHMINEVNQQWQEKGAESKSPFLAWQPVQLLVTIAKDLDPNPKLSESLVDDYNLIGNTLFNTKQGLDRKGQKAIIDWNTSLWKGLDTWGEEDPVHKKMIIPLKTTYYQSMVLLEDHFMNEGLQPLEAKGLALNLLQTIVAPYLESYKM